MRKAFEPDEMSWAYEMFVSTHFSQEDVASLPFSSVYGRVPPGTVSKKHSHQDSELYIALGGRASVLLNGKEHILSRGDSLYIAPFTAHEIRNDSPDEHFDIVSLSWEAEAEIAGGLASETKVPTALVVTPPPTPNGGLHLGHLAGPYLRADMLARGYEIQGISARHLTGLDVPQSYVEASAAGKSGGPEGLAAEQSARIERSFTDWNVRVDRLVDPTTDAQVARRVLELYDALAHSGHVDWRDIPVAECAACARELFQGLVAGRCPGCGADSSGDLCEACGRPEYAARLKDPHCQLCGGDVTVTTQRRPVLNFDALSEAIRSIASVDRSSSDFAALVDQLTRTDPLPYPIMRKSLWGRALSKEDGYVVDPWLDLCLTYFAAVEEEAATEITLLLGFDNTYYYGMLLSGVAEALGLTHMVPTKYVTNRFLNLDDRKFSTSRGHAVWADDTDLLGGADTEAIRVALLRSAPEGRERSVDRATILNAGTESLPADVQELVARAIEGIRSFDGVVPPTGAWTQAQTSFYDHLRDSLARLEALLRPERFRASDYVATLDALVQHALSLIESERGLAKAPGLTEEWRTSVALAVVAAREATALLYPLAPVAAAAQWRELSLQGVPTLGGAAFLHSVRLIPDAATEPQLS